MATYSRRTLLAAVSHLEWFKRPEFRRERLMEHFPFVTASHILYRER